MSLIERVQKEVLFEEAAKKGITKRSISTVGQIFSELLGQTDIGKMVLGEPLAPLYNVQNEDDEVDIERISKYMSGLFRDVQVLSQAAESVENQLLFMNLEFWARTQLIRNKARLISEAAIAERQRVVTGGRWAFSDSFNNTDYLDMQRTTAWIDTSEGVAILPNLSTEQTLLPQDLSILEQSIPDGSSALGSSAQHAIDGLENTNWRVQFSAPDTYASCTLKLVEPKAISSITIDPVGAGALVVVEVDRGKGFEKILREFVYNKQTWPVDGQQTVKIRVSFSVAGSSLPAVAGIRSLTFFTAHSTRVASIYTRAIRPQYSFNEIWVKTDNSVPNGALLQTFWSTASGGPWLRAENQVWHSVNQSQTTVKFIDGQSSFAQEGGLFRVSLPDQSINDIDGLLTVGLNQIEISAFKFDWLSVGESPKVLSPSDFTGRTLTRTWAYVPKMQVSSFENYPRILQTYGSTSLQSSPHSLKRGSNSIVRRKVSDQPYEELCWAPLTGFAQHHTIQPTYNYRFRLMVFCSSDSFYEGGKYWFLQGYRQAGARTYKEIGRSWGAFSLYINGTLTAADNLPYTLFSDNTLESGTELGRPFSIKLKTGWNTVEIFMNVADTHQNLRDVFDLGDPYLQLCLMPSFLDESFQQLMNITQISGTGERKPVSEFDLLWNLPLDPAFWAWNSSRDGVLLNSIQTRPIDGFLLGTYPRSQLSYQGVDFAQESEDLYFRFDLSRNEQSLSGPTLQGYKVMVR